MTDKSWVDILVQTSRERASEGRRLNLAQIPAVLRSLGVDVKEITQERTLSEVLAQDSAGKLRVVDIGGGQIYLEAVEDGYYSQAASGAAVGQTVRPSPSMPRFKRAFWTAFVKPFDEEKSR